MVPANLHRPPLFHVHTDHSDVKPRTRAPSVSRATTHLPVTRKLLRIFFSVAAFMMALWLVTGAVLHLSGWRDRLDGLSVVYYTTPWPVISVGVAALAVGAHRQRRARSAVILGVVGICAGIAWISTSWYSAPLSNKVAEVRVVFWNVRNNPDDMQAMAARIREFSPDIVALAEAGKHLSSIDEWRAIFPEYKVERLPQQMLMMSRIGLQQDKSGVLAPGSFFGTRTGQIGSRPVTIMQADIDARPLRSRRTAFEVLTAHVRERAAQPLILLGDFNTPRRSYHLDSIRGMLKHAFETQGSGLADTWPIPFPVLSLDQVWVSPHLEVVSCRQGWSIMSDHRPVFVELRFR